MTRSAKPAWLRRRLPTGPAFEETRRRIREGRLHTVCQEANCPNLFECFARHTATFLILGDHCTRNCAFCAVRTGSPARPDPLEPQRVAEAAEQLGLAYVVITSVTRDDLPDGGAAAFAATIRAVHKQLPQAHVEVLIPDFQGDAVALQTVLAAGPSVLNHNLETVPRLYPTVRPQADYHRSLELLARVARYTPQIPTKSGLMLGLGENEVEIHQALTDLRRVGCRILTLGQYLQPSAAHHPVVAFIPPQRFDAWRQTALEMGFIEAVCAPFARSSYHAGEVFAHL